jgi:hypothetical protein
LSFLTLIQKSAARINLLQPTSAFTSADSNVAHLVALAQEEGIELAKAHNWTALTKEQTFTSTAAAAQTSGLPSDFDRFIDDAFYNRTQKRPVYGPISPQDWQFTQSVVAGAAITESFRVRGTSILITPTPNGTDTYAYEYISNQWCESSGGTDQSAWASDTDVGLIPEELMVLGVIWRFRAAKGLDYSEPFRTYQLQVANAISRDGGRRILSFGKSSFRGPRGPLVPEGSWNL